MAIAVGTRLGPYEIMHALGAGGMGEVYKARDTRLERTVAVKVLSAHLSDNPDLKQRFDREARAISAAHAGEQLDSGFEEMKSAYRVGRLLCP